MKIFSMEIRCMQAKERLLSRNGRMRDDLLSLFREISITDLHRIKRLVVRSEKLEERNEK